MISNEELEEAYNTINTLRQEINEIKLLNAKLLYSNKIFKASIIAFAISESIQFTATVAVTSPNNF